jgi:hypothetical protein
MILEEVLQYFRDGDDSPRLIEAALEHLARELRQVAVRALRVRNSRREAA